MSRAIGIAVGASVGAHAVSTMMGLARSAWLLESREPLRGQAGSDSGSIDSAATAAASATVLSMYGRGCVDEHCFSPSVVFTDPAAETRGVAELAEAFRALQIMKPVNEEFNFVAHHEPGCACVDLWQRYTIFGRPFKLYSRVLARHDAAGRIESIREWWRGVPLSDAALLAIARRVNGVISYQLTPWLPTKR